MPRRQPKDTLLILEIISVAAYVYYVWSMSKLVPETESDASTAGIYLRVAGVCYSIAHWFGQVGMKAEQHCYDIIEENRTV